VPEYVNADEDAVPDDTLQRHGNVQPVPDADQDALPDVALQRHRELQPVSEADADEVRGRELLPLVLPIPALALRRLG
jgi:hypothetical protein